MQRCYNPKQPNFERYGGRGVTVCSRWHSFENFLADMGQPVDKRSTSIERIDRAKGYSPENCKWVYSYSEQSRNRSTNRLIEWNGQIKSMLEWCEILKIDRQTLKSRLDLYGWSIERAFTTPVKKR